MLTKLKDTREDEDGARDAEPPPDKEEKTKDLKERIRRMVEAMYGPTTEGFRK